MRERIGRGTVEGSLPRWKEPTMTTTAPAALPDPDRVTDLRSALGGSVALPGGPAYDAALDLWNGMIASRPALVVRPRGPADVVTALRAARDLGLEVSVKGGGHNVAGHASTDGGLMLDLELLRGVRVDPVRRRARVGGGARWSDVDRETGVFGLATTGGVISTTGVGGLTLGGGVGWLVGKHGLACDNLLSVDLVTAAGEVVTASEAENADLFWALRGGGGNFGVVTSLEFALHPQPTVFAGMVAHPPDRAPAVLELYREVTEDAPDELGVYCGLMAEPEHGMRVAALPFCWSGDPDAGEDAVRPLLEQGEPVMVMADQMPYPVWNAANDVLFPPGRRYYWKGAMLRDLDDRVLAAVADLAAEPPRPWFSVAIEGYAGVMNRVDPDSTAFPHREARYQAVVSAAWEDPADDALAREWAREVHDAVSPYALEGEFLNFVVDDGAAAAAGGTSARVRAGYGRSWERLREVKRRWDPDNVFHRNNTVLP